MQLFQELIENFSKRFKQEKLTKVLEDFYKESEILLEYDRIYDSKELDFRLASLESLKGMAKKFEEKNKQEENFASLEEFLKELSLFNQDDTEDEENNQNKAHIMTIHSAKGLEFQAVFLPGFEEKTIPHDRSLEEGPKAIEEERRLALQPKAGRSQGYLLPPCMLVWI